MRIWVAIIVSGIFSCLSFYMTLLAFRSGDRGMFLFAGFGLLSGAFFVATNRRILIERGVYGRKTDDTICGNPEPASFVPHWFVMAALTVTVIAILCAVLIPTLWK